MSPRRKPRNLRPASKRAAPARQGGKLRAAVKKKAARSESKRALSESKRVKKVGKVGTARAAKPKKRLLRLVKSTGRTRGGRIPPGAKGARGRARKVALKLIKSRGKLAAKIRKARARQSAVAQRALAARKKDEKTLLDLYERGIKALYNRNYQQALDLFERLIQKYPEEIELADRARNFVKICQSQGATRRVQQPKTPEEMFDLGVIEHNSGSFQQAIEFFQRAIELNPKADYIHYALAASLSQAGEAERAIHSLQRSIQLNTDNKFLARNDPDFEPIRNTKEFDAVVEVPKT